MINSLNDNKKQIMATMMGNLFSTVVLHNPLWKFYSIIKLNLKSYLDVPNLSHEYPHLLPYLPIILSITYYILGSQIIISPSIDLFRFKNLWISFNYWSCNRLLALKWLKLHYLSLSLTKNFNEIIISSFLSVLYYWCQIFIIW